MIAPSDERGALPENWSAVEAAVREVFALETAVTPATSVCDDLAAAEVDLLDLGRVLLRDHGLRLDLPLLKRQLAAEPRSVDLSWIASRLQRPSTRSMR